jgi:hypothetical protein
VPESLRKIIFLGSKVRPVLGPPSVNRLCRQCRILNISEPYRLHLFFFFFLCLELIACEIRVLAGIIPLRTATLWPMSAHLQRRDVLRECAISGITAACHNYVRQEVEGAFSKAVNIYTRAFRRCGCWRRCISALQEHIYYSFMCVYRPAL